MIWTKVSISDTTLGFRNASYKTLVNIQHLKQNILDMILKTLINKNKLLKEW